MGIVKSYPVTKIVAGKEIKTSDSILCTSNYYKTNGESAIVINSNTECTLVLDETTTDHVTIKAMSDVKVVTDKLIDDEFEEFYSTNIHLLNYVILLTVGILCHLMG